VRGGIVYPVPVQYDTGNKTGKKTPGGAGKHTGHTGDTQGTRGRTTGIVPIPVLYRPVPVQLYCTGNRTIPSQLVQSSHVKS
jgi:hypothetical protein